MNSTITHLLHAIIIAAVLYLVMKFVLGQSCDMATRRSVLVGAIVLIYMILFGHGLPTRVPSI